jgi:citrate lyase beta subunit
MKCKWIYQYISLNQNENKILQTIRKSSKACILPLLDLEDSLQIPLDPKKTSSLKARAREILRHVLEMAMAQDLKVKICLRINACDTEEFKKDIEMLQQLAPLVSWAGLFLPKVHSVEVLQEYMESLNGIHYDELVVMAESKAFFENQKEIIRLCNSSNIDKIHFGHWDYFYDAREFPVPLPDDEKLWRKVEMLIRTIEASGIHYIHTPFCFLLNLGDFQSIAAYLNKTTTLPFGMSTLSFSQAQAVCNINSEVIPINPVTYYYTKSQREIIANDLIKFFNRPVSPEYSFNINKTNYRFYAPHEYLNALDYTKNH